MAANYQVQTEDRTYTVVNDVTTIYQVLIIGSVQDQTTAGPIQEPISVQISRPDLDPKVVTGGYYVVSGDPEVSFPNLATTSYSFTVTISADGFVSQSFSITIPANSTFPITQPMVVLARTPIRIQGRVTKSTSDRSPVAGAKIMSVDDPLVTPLQHTLALRTPLYFSHASGVAVRERPLSAIGPSKQLTANVPAGTTTMLLSNRSGLAANRILSFGQDIQIEYAVIASMDPLPADLTQPGNITLQNGLNHSFPAGTTVQRVTLGAIGTSRNLQTDTSAGDGLVILDGLLNVDTVEVADPAATKLEYHAVGALTNSDGFYGLDGIGRVSQLSLNASATGLHDSTANWVMDYSAFVNVVDFRLSP